jgi:predicted metalloprotease with PDZ domain
MIKNDLKQVMQIPLIGAILLILSCNIDAVIFEGLEPPESINLSESFYYRIDLTNRVDDKFRVSFFTEGLTSANSIFQFPVTVPGTYRILDFGRFISDFKVYDENNNQLNATRINNGQWEFESPEDVYRIEIEIYETWDTPVEENQIFKMSGTSLEDNHALLNMFGILGYPTGLKDRNFYIELVYPDNWTVGTSLTRTTDGYYWAQNYDYLVDSPILLGEISYYSLDVNNSDINIYTYSELGKVQSSDLAQDLKKVIEDASEFLEVLPVDRYNFLYLFEGTKSAGALEHSFSSVYVMGEFHYSEFGNTLKDIAAHEFFHIVVPLNIHSEIIGDFNFAVPTPSEHLWLYEGVTEWASDFMQFRNNSITIDDLFLQFTLKIENDKKYDANYSLGQISLTSYTPEGVSQFGNVYNRGSMTATLLDIRLLELSNGEKGLRELILDLIEIYGPEHSFPENQFFDVLVEMTYPEIQNFIDNYIRGAEPLPYVEYFETLGINYDQGSNVFSIKTQMTTSQEYLYNRWRINF